MNTLAAKVVKASHEVGALATDKKNPQGNYDYISSDKILQRAGDALANNGLSLVPSITSATVESYRTNEQSKPYWCANVSMVMTLSDGETTLEYPWHGMGTDYTVADKAFFKAITGGHKYFLMKLLNIGVGNEDGEHEAPPPETQNGGAQQQTRPAAAAVANGTATGKSNGSGPANGGAPVEQDDAHKRFHALGVELYGTSKEWDAKRPGIIKGATKDRTESSKDLTPAELAQLIKILDGRVQAKRAELNGITVAGAQEMAH
jgi:hypothetical protein